jgi:hypothetical protein
MYDGCRIIAILVDDKPLPGLARIKDDIAFLPTFSRSEAASKDFNRSSRSILLAAECIGKL